MIQTKEQHKRGKYSARVFEALLAAGPDGITVADLVEKMGTKTNELSAWHCKTGKNEAKITDSVVTTSDGFKRNSVIRLLRLDGKNPFEQPASEGEQKSDGNQRKKLLTTAQWQQWADVLFLSLLENPLDGVTMQLLKDSMEKALPPELHRKHVSGLSQVPTLKKLLEPMLREFAEAYINPRVEYVPTAQPIDIDAVLNEVPIEKLAMVLQTRMHTLNEERHRRQEEQIHRLQQMVDRLATTLEKTSFKAIASVQASLEEVHAQTPLPVPQAPKVKKHRAFICGVQANRLARMKRIVQPLPVEIIGSFFCHEQSVSSGRVPRSADIYIVDTEQTSHKARQSVEAAVGRERCRYVRGSNAVEAVLKQIAEFGPNRVLSLFKSPAPAPVTAA